MSKITKYFILNLWVSVLKRDASTLDVFFFFFFFFVVANGNKLNV